ncbi:histidine phosphotransferase ChpT [Lichenihabitans psoromatis]|uniref:histidine phosphotransferase ChpT n=1 Tax=Lichenihabitans psoromatis TaxID=2528642 RepID=UPI001035DFEC|nr:histidine phosphotransferase family protein [Lichenihabitans psoromatis]
MTTFALDALDLAALLCSRVCHDVISPVGAIVNGLEVLEDDNDADTRVFALDLIKKSANTASAKLQFCRLAFGAAGSAGASIDTGDAESVTRGLFGDDKVKLDWTAPRVLMPKNKVKLILNLCVIAAGTIPRGGVVTVSTSGPSEAPDIRLVARGINPRVNHALAGLLAGKPENDTIDAHAIQPFFTGLVARQIAYEISIGTLDDVVLIEAKPVAAPVHADTVPSAATATERDPNDVFDL